MTIEERIGELEQANRHLARLNRNWRWAAVALAVTTLAAWVFVGCEAGQSASQPSFTSVRARFFTVVDKEGNALVSIGPDLNNGSGMINTYDSQGNELVRITSNKDNEGAIVTLNAQGNALVALAADGEGAGEVTTSNGKGKCLISLGTNNNGGFLSVWNKTGEGIVQLHADDYGNGVVGAFNRKGKGRTLESK